MLWSHRDRYRYTCFGLIGIGTGTHAWSHRDRYRYTCFGLIGIGTGTHALVS